MATCWYCDSFAEDPAAECRFCGAATLGSKPKWVTVLDSLPAPEDQTRGFIYWYVVWEIVLVILGLMYWPWWAALGALFIGLFLAAPFALASSILMEQSALPPTATVLAPEDVARLQRAKARRAIRPCLAALKTRTRSPRGRRARILRTGLTCRESSQIVCLVTESLLL